MTRGCGPAAPPTRRAALALGAASILAAGPLAARENGPPDEAEAIAITVRPIPHFFPRQPDQARFGKLIYRGGLQLSSAAPGFGGFSGLALSGAGDRLVAVSDRGAWLTAKVERREGRLVGLSDAALAPMLNAAGRPLSRTRSYDVEALSLVGGVAHVAIERSHEILRYDFGRRGVLARATSVAVPRELKALPRNRGLEGLGLAPPASPVAGALFALSERSGEHDVPTLGALIGGPQPGLLHYQLRDGFEVTDLAFLPDGDVLVLERWYRAWRGVGMRIRRVPGRTIMPGALLEGEMLIEADLAQEIDNMEGLAVQAREGRTMLTLISDDNFSGLQRTIVLEFELAA